MFRLLRSIYYVSFIDGCLGFDVGHGRAVQ